MASRKVFDIIPPKESLPIGRQGKEFIPPVRPQKRPDFVNKLTPPAPKIKPGINKKTIWWPVLTILVIICIGGASYFLIKPKAELAIWPVKTPLILKTQVVVGKDITKTLETYDYSFSQEFPATGVKSANAKATGTIRVYNAYSLSPQTLIASTRFVSDGGKLFRTPQKVVIPGAHYEGSKLIPGEVDIVVEAGESGDNYNIGPSTFSLPALAGTSRYTAFYAKSFASMTGGAKNQTVQVSQEDLAHAQNILTTKALEDSKKALIDSLSPEEYVIIEEALKSEIIELNPLVQVGQEVQNFTYQIKAKATALVSKKKDLEDFTKSYLLTQVPEGKQLNENSLVITYAPENVDWVKGRIVLTAEISAEVYPVIDENAIKEAVSNQRLDEMAASLKRFSEVDRFQARLWPFWADKAPLGTEGINIKLRLD